MRRALAAFLALLLVLILPTVQALSVTRPAYGPGDSWRYAIEVTESGQRVGEGTREVVVHARGPFDYQGAKRDAVVVGTYDNLTVAGAATRTQTTSTYDAATGALLARTSEAGSELADEPCVEIRYPVQAGEGWTSRCTIDGAERETMYLPAGSERIVVGGRPYETIVVDYVHDTSGRLWLSPDACGRPVAEFSQVNERATFVNLTRVECQRTDAPAAPSPTTPTGGATVPTAPTAATPTPRPATPTPTTAAPLAYPTLTEGDAWFFHANVTIQGKRYQVQTRESMGYVLNDSRAGKPPVPMDMVFHVDDLYDGEIGFFSDSGWAFETRLRRSDGATLYEVASNYSTEVPDPAGPPTSRYYDEPCAFVKWPITPGTSWRIECRGFAEEPPVLASEFPKNRRNFTLTGEGRAEPVRRVTVPAGTFDGYPVTISYRTSDGFARTETRVYAREACGLIERTPGMLGADQRDTLSSFRCQALGTGSYVPPTPPTGTDTPGLGAAFVALALVAAALVAKKRS